MNQTDIEKLIRELLICIGEDPNREGLLETPSRVAKSFKEIFCGYLDDATEILATTFSQDLNYNDFVSLYDISFASTCEHHMLPFSGTAHVGYVPNGKVVGLSKLARLVESHSKKLQIQERMTSDIANDLQRVLSPNGVIVVIEAHHSCMSCRGIKKQNSRMVTKCHTGVFSNNNYIRNEFMSLIK